MFRVLISTTVKFVALILGLYSLFMLFRGHNEPGGGFIGGLLLALGGILYDFFDGKKSYLTKVNQSFHFIMGALLLLFILTVTYPIFKGLPFLKGIWTKVSLPMIGKISSVLAFDMIIYFIVGVGVFYSYTLIKETNLKG